MTVQNFFFYIRGDISPVVKDPVNCAPGDIGPGGNIFNGDPLFRLFIVHFLIVAVLFNHLGKCYTNSTTNPFSVNISYCAFIKTVIAPQPGVPLLFVSLPKVSIHPVF